MFRRFLPVAAAIVAACLAVMLAPDAALADKRVALVIGNSAYRKVTALPNAAGDALSVAGMLRNAGFDGVDLELDIDKAGFSRAISDFTREAASADTAVIYYTGHGLEISGTTYLVPVDATINRVEDVGDETIPLERLMASATGATHLRLVILDTSRSNPFVAATRREPAGLAAGLARVEPISPDTMIFYSAKAGQDAQDGDGAHSPFTTALLKSLTVPGLDIRRAFGSIRDDVLKMTNNRQEPFAFGSLGGGNVALVPESAPPPQDAVKAEFELVDKIGSPAAYNVFLRVHSTGDYADRARAKLKELTGKDSAPR